MKLTRNFDDSEFYCHCGCGKTYPGGVPVRLVEGLQKIRDTFGCPVTVLSGFRCGSKSSRHYTDAADITLGGKVLILDAFSLAIELFPRVGIYRSSTTPNYSSMHVDLYDDKGELYWWRDRYRENHEPGYLTYNPKYHYCYTPNDLLSDIVKDDWEATVI